VRMQNGTDALASMRNCINTEVRFRALLSQNETRQLEVVRTRRILGRYACLPISLSRSDNQPSIQRGIRACVRGIRPQAG
jgi:hypothetical protein